MVRMGAGLAASPERPEQIAVRLLGMIHSEQFANAAQAFAARFADFDPQRQVAKMVQRAENLLEVQATTG